MNLRAKAYTALLLGALSFTPAAWAGRSCEPATISPERTAAIFESASRLEAALTSSKQSLVVLARRGQNLEKYGVTFSHAAFALKKDGDWLVYHDLNKCGSAVSALFVQGLAEFLADDLYAPDVAMVAPEPWLQDRLIEVLTKKEEQFRMHETAYSALAYPYAIRYQNSNGWLLETYARAAAEVLLPDRSSAQTWLKQAGYTPSIVELGMLTRLGARVFKANVAFDDHPSELRWNGKITVSTGDSVLHFVAKGAIPNENCNHGNFAPSVCILDKP